MDKTKAMIVVTIVLSINMVLGIAFLNPVFSKENSQVNLHQNHDRKRIGMKMLNKLNLSKDQKAAIKPLIENFKQKMKPGREKVIQARAKIFQLILSGELSKNQVQEEVQNISTLKEEIMVSRVMMMGKIIKILTPKQVEEFKKFKAERMQKFRSGRNIKSENFGS